jgi:hypothetical protein
MAKKIKEKHRGMPFKLFGMILLSLPSLLFKSGGAFLRFKREAKKGGQIFQRELVKQGIDKSTADELTEVYMGGSNIVKSLVSMR